MSCARLLCAPRPVRANAGFDAFEKRRVLVLCVVRLVLLMHMHVLLAFCCRVICCLLRGNYSLVPGYYFTCGSRGLRMYSPLPVASGPGYFVLVCVYSEELVNFDFLSHPVHAQVHQSPRIVADGGREVIYTKPND